MGPCDQSYFVSAVLLMWKYIIIIIDIKKEIINEKIGNIVREGTGEDKLIKPNLILHP